MKIKFRAQCKSHDWEGMMQNDKEAAIRDLDAHITQEGGDHDGKIIEIQVLDVE